MTLSTVTVHDCPADGKDYHGRCLGHCRECDEHLLCTGRYTTYCPDCDACHDCGCPSVDGFNHYAGCLLNQEPADYELDGVEVYS